MADDLTVHEAAYFETLDSIKREISNSRARAALAANSELVCMYWRIGHSIDLHSEWGLKYLESLSYDIRMAFPQAKGFSVRNLKYMLKFSREFEYEKVQRLVAQIPWGHITHLMDKVSDREQRDWYIGETIQNGWSRSVLMHQISIKLFERQAGASKVTNFKKLLPAADSEMAQQALKDPYVFDFITTREGLVERDIEEQMVQNVTSLLLELGTGFAFVGRQYHLVVGDADFYIDLLFYNLKLRRYVIVELKNEEFKPEFAGKLGFYVAAVDGELRGEYDNPSIGLLLCKTKDNAVAEYSLEAANKPIGVSEYRTADELPEEMRGILPSPEDILSRI